MQKFQFTVTVPASGGSNRIRISDAAIAANAVSPGAVAVGHAISAYLPACKLFVQMQAASSGGPGFMGDVTVDQTGAGGALVLQAAVSSTVPGAAVSIEDQANYNSVNLGDYYLHGATPGNIITVWYHQN